MIRILCEVRDLLDRRPWFAAALAAMAISIVATGAIVTVAIVGVDQGRLGIDYRQYIEAARRWLDDGTFYQPWQLSGPYQIPRNVVLEIPELPVLYPPPALLLFLPFLLLPAVAWWVIPLAVTSWMLWMLRPRPWTWPLIAALALAGDGVWLVLSGNPVMWSMMALATASRFPGASLGVLLKPSIPLLPFLLFRAGHGSWWLTLAGACLAGIAFAPMWPDFLAAIANARGADLLYSLGNVPMLLVPIVAWWGRGTDTKRDIDRSSRNTAVADRSVLGRPSAPAR